MVHLKYQLKALSLLDNAWLRVCYSLQTVAGIDACEWFHFTRMISYVFRSRSSGPNSCHSRCTENVLKSQANRERDCPVEYSSSLSAW